VAAAGPRLAVVWQAECRPAAGCRVAGRSTLARGWLWQARYTEPPGGAAARVAAAGPRLALVWQAQYTELP